MHILRIEYMILQGVDQVLVGSSIACPRLPVPYCRRQTELKSVYNGAIMILVLKLYRHRRRACGEPGQDDCDLCRREARSRCTHQTKFEGRTGSRAMHAKSRYPVPHWHMLEVCEFT